MTADDFEMTKHGFLGEGEWRIRIRDCDTIIQADVYDDAMQECIADNFDYIIDTVGKEITERVFNMNDLGQITDEEKAIFNRIMLMVIG